MSKKIQIIPATKTDAKSVFVIFTNARANMTYLPIVHTQQEIEKFFTTLVVKGKIMLIKEDTTTLGFMEIGDGWLHHLYIAPQFQDKGVGKLLLDKAKELSPMGMQLMVFENNKDAIRFYEREGFILVEKRNQEQTKNEENLPDRRYAWKAMS